MEKNMETTTMGFYRVLGIVFRVWGLGFRVGMKEWKRTRKLLQWVT